MKNQLLSYTGNIALQPEPGEPDEQGRILYPYIPTEELRDAVNLAILLERPLLLKGEPGCGKTQLARAVAYELKLPFEAWYVKSTSQASDGLYTYDAVSRLRDAQLAVVRHQNPEQLPLEDDYIRFGPLGRSFLNEKRTVVLIDEIDKADIDFPNDLLLELDEQRFVIEELQPYSRYDSEQNRSSDKTMIRAKHPPIVFITSNDEKDLPDAFLRRCLFHYIEFPKPERLKAIIEARFGDITSTLIDSAIERFVELRRAMDDQGRVRKKVSTSELIDWVRVLSHYAEDKDLRQLKDRLLYPGVLLKNWDDYRRFSELRTADDDQLTKGDI